MDLQQSISVQVVLHHVFCDLVLDDGLLDAYGWSNLHLCLLLTQATSRLSLKTTFGLRDDFTYVDLLPGLVLNILMSLWTGELLAWNG